MQCTVSTPSNGKRVYYLGTRRFQIHRLLDIALLSRRASPNSDKFKLKASGHWVIMIHEPPTCKYRALKYLLTRGYLATPKMFLILLQSHQLHVKKRVALSLLAIYALQIAAVLTILTLPRLTYGRIGIHLKVHNSVNWRGYLGVVIAGTSYMWPFQSPYFSQRNT